MQNKLCNFQKDLNNQNTNKRVTVNSKISDTDNDRARPERNSNSRTDN